MTERPLRPDPRVKDLPDDTELPPETAPGAIRHPAANLELVGRAGTLLLLGVVLGLLLLDLQRWRQGAGFSGQSLVAVGGLGVTVLPVGALSWAAGWRLRRQRGEEPVLAPDSALKLNVAAPLAGLMLALLLGLPG